MEDILYSIGITPNQARAYLKLLENEFVFPAQFCVDIYESRTNTYKILDELVSKGLARKDKKNKKLVYIAESPVVLGQLARELKDAQIQAEKNINESVAELLKKYNKTHEKPGVTFFQGKTGIEDIYKQQIQENKPINFLKTREDIKFFGFDFMHKIRNLAPKAGIKRKAFTPDAPEVPKNVSESDKKMLLERTWYLPNDYTAPVEWSVFGNKVSIISFGKEAIGLVIDSPQVAESLRQIFSLLEEGLKRRPGYDDLPKLGEFTDVDSFVAKYNNKAPEIPNKSE